MVNETKITRENTFNGNCFGAERNNDKVTTKNFVLDISADL